MLLICVVYMKNPRRYPRKSSSIFQMVDKSNRIEKVDMRTLGMKIPKGGAYSAARALTAVVPTVAEKKAAKLSPPTNTTVLAAAAEKYGASVTSILLHEEGSNPKLVLHRMDCNRTMYRMSKADQAAGKMNPNYIVFDSIGLLKQAVVNGWKRRGSAPVFRACTNCVRAGRLTTTLQ